MFKVQFRIRHKDGYIVWIEHKGKAVIDENGLYLGYRANNRDITPYKNSIETIAKMRYSLKR